MSKTNSQSASGTQGLAAKFEREAAKQAPKESKLPAKSTAPVGESTASNKAFFEQQIKAQKPAGKTNSMAAKFERKIDKQTEESEFQKNKQPKPQKNTSQIAKQFEQQQQTSNKGEASKLRDKFEILSTNDADKTEQGGDEIPAEPEEEQVDQGQGEGQNQDNQEEHVDQGQEEEEPEQQY